MDTQIVNSLIKQSLTAIPKNEGDYLGKDGLLYCGKCHTKKQTEVIFRGMKRHPMCLCKCETEKRDKEEAEKKKNEFEQKVKELRRVGFPECSMQEWSFANDDMSNSKVTNAMKKYVDNFEEMKKQGKGLLLFCVCSDLILPPESTFQEFGHKFVCCQYHQAFLSCLFID